MSDVFYLRPIDPPAAPAAVQEMARHAGGCLKLHRVDWRQSFLAKDGKRMLCWYRAPDAESARLALRELGSNMNAVWAGRVAGRDAAGSVAAGASVPDTGAASPVAPGAAPADDDCVVAEIVFDKARGEGELASLAASLTPDGAVLARAFVSSSGNRLVCVFASADEGAVQAGLAEAGLGAETAVWPCIAITPSLPD